MSLSGDQVKKARIKFQLEKDVSLYLHSDTERLKSFFRLLKQISRISLPMYFCVILYRHGWGVYSALRVKRFNDFSFFLHPRKFIPPKIDKSWKMPLS